MYGLELSESSIQTGLSQSQFLFANIAKKPTNMPFHALTWTKVSFADNPAFHQVFVSRS